MKDLGIVVPFYNEQDYLIQFIKEWEPVLEGITYSILLIDDGSKDNSEAVLQDYLKNKSSAVIYLKKENSGHGRTCRYGYEYAINTNEYKWVLQVDSDGQCDPKYFKKFWNSRTNVDAVWGLRKRRDDGFARVIISTLCSVLTMIATHVDPKDANVPYRLIRTEILKEALAHVPKDFDIQNVALTVVLKKLKNRVKWNYVQICFRDRTTGTNSINIPKIMKMGMSMLREVVKIKVK